MLMKKRTISEQAAVIPMRRLPGFKDLPFTGGQLREAIIYKMIEDLLRPEIPDPEQLQDACNTVFKKTMDRADEFGVKSPTVIVGEEVVAFLGQGSSVRNRLSSEPPGPEDK